MMLVDRSDQILKDVRADALAWLSEFSGIGFELRLDHFGQAISAVLTSEVKEVSSEVREAAELVKSHRFAARLRPAQIRWKWLYASCNGSPGAGE